MTDELFASPPPVLGVSELNRRIRGLLEDGLGEVWVEGEISNHRLQSSGHQYFTLKDDRSQLACVLFARSAGRVKLSDGLAVQIFGQITVYEARGQVQMIVQVVQPRGLGVLQAKFEALKRKLDAEGLFDPARKRPLPRFPRRIGLVTSPTGAALQDMLNILARRAPWVQIVIHPVKVQGDGAAPEIAAAIRDFGKNFATGPARLDLLIVGRGGGSIEDLWAFNEEIVARAIHECPLPVVSAVGHEIDFTIADFVADLRAPTPSAAAEIVTPDGAELARRLEHFGHRLRQTLRGTLAQQRERLLGRLAPALPRETARQLDAARQKADELSVALLRQWQERLATLRQRHAGAAASLRQHRPDQMLALKRQTFLRTQEQFGQVISRKLAAQQERLTRLTGQLRLLGPQATLERGYTMTTTADGRVLTSVAAVASGEKIKTRFHDGEILSQIKASKGRPK